MYKHIKNATFFVLALLASSAALSAPFSVTFTDTISGSANPLYINGEAFSITIVLDNGGASTISQIWTAANLVSITFSLNDAPGALTTTLEPNTAPGDGLDATFGNFSTDAAGNLVTVLNIWDDNSLLNPTSSNDSSTFGVWLLDGTNAILFTSGGFVGATNVVAIRTTAGWSNPAAVGGGGGGGSAAEAAPTLSEWMLILLALVLGGIGYTAAMKARKN